MAVVRTVLLACCLLGLSLPAPAAGAGSGDALFVEGVSAFKSGDHTAAADLFQQALAAGLDTPAVHYNLGATLYELGRYAEAEEAFRACARDPAWSALAWYNMGLSAYARGERELAREYAADARRNAEAGEVRALAVALLERLGVPRRPVRGMLQVYVGHDSNVALTADDQILEATREADSFTEFLASADGHLGAGGDASRWEASLYNLSYRTLSENDITQLLLGVSRPATYAGWRWEAGLRWQHLWLDGHSLQQIATLRLEGARTLDDRRELRASARVSGVDARDPEFAFLQGSRRQLDVSLGQPAAGGWIRTGITWERNDRADRRMGQKFFSFSPTRYGLWIAGTWPVRDRWRFEPLALYYRSRYADPDRRVGEDARTREDNHTELSLRARRRLSTAWQLMAEYTYIDNDSNLAELSYSRRLILLGLLRSL